MNGYVRAGLALALLIPSAAQANDRDLRARPIPPSACAQAFNAPDNLRGQSSVLQRGSYALQAFRVSKLLEIHCPLPVNNIELSSRSSDNDLSRIRIHYEDSDGFGSAVSLAARLVRHNVGGPQITVTPICSWNSNTQGTGGTGLASSTFACPHDLDGSGFYYVEVEMRVSSTLGGFGGARFFGIDFP